jgi:DNA-directed RNA polymerase specialized sigma24 family protein
MHFRERVLFATVRRVLEDRMARRRVVSFEVGRDLDDLKVLIDERPAGADEELRSLAQALSILPPRCRQVVWMRRVEQKSQKKNSGVSRQEFRRHLLFRI